MDHVSAVHDEAGVAAMIGVGVRGHGGGGVCGGGLI